MRAPDEKAAYPHFVTFGRYTARYLRSAGFNDLSASVKEATARAKELGRAWEDAAEPLQDAMADRNFADLRDRLVKYLPEGDKALEKYVPRLNEGMTAYQTAQSAVSAARNGESMARHMRA